MMIYPKKTAPSLAPLSDEEQVTSLVEAKAPTCEDRWVDSFIARLTDVIRDMKQQPVAASNARSFVPRK
jgi:hypothetical protein